MRWLAAALDFATVSRRRAGALLVGRSEFDLLTSTRRVRSGPSHLVGSGAGRASAYGLGSSCAQVSSLEDPAKAGGRTKMGGVRVR